MPALPPSAKLIAGNWKMNGLLASQALVDELVAEWRGDVVQRAEMMVCPPATLLHAFSPLLRKAGITPGGQDCHAAPSGAFTGDVSAEMLADAGAGAVILGHSERRAMHGETSAQVADKVKAAWRAGLVAIVCVGETLEERDAGRAFDVVQAQLEGSVPLSGANAQTFVLAYEPVWAIGTGRTAAPADIAAMHAHIRGWLERALPAHAAGVRILYGGSVKPDNAAEILAVENVDGALVGGASLKADDFLAIARAAPDTRA